MRIYEKDGFYIDYKISLTKDLWADDEGDFYTKKQNDPDARKEFVFDYNFRGEDYSKISRIIDKIENNENSYLHFYNDIYYTKNGNLKVYSSIRIWENNTPNFYCFEGNGEALSFKEYCLNIDKYNKISNDGTKTKLLSRAETLELLPKLKALKSDFEKRLNNAYDKNPNQFNIHGYWANR